MKLLGDSDAFCKLEGAGLLDHVAGLLGASRSECGRLPALPYMLRRGRLAQRLGAAAPALAAAAAALPTFEDPAPHRQEPLKAIDGIDAGEALLFAAAAERGLPLITGDKRALRALKHAPSVVAALCGRVVTVEAALLALCHELGDEPVRAAVSTSRAVDKVMTVCFSSGVAAPRALLATYQAGIETEVAPLRLWSPEAARRG